MSNAQSGSLNLTAPRAPAAGAAPSGFQSFVPARRIETSLSALGRHPPDQPVRPAAARAMVDLAVMIHRVIAAGARVERGAAGLDRTQHGHFLRNHLPVPTSGESLGFKDDP